MTTLRTANDVRSVEDQTAALCRAITRITAQHIGRGPTYVRMATSPNILCFVLVGTLTKAEQTLVAAGRGATVADLRRVHHATMRDALIQSASEHTGRVVAALLSDHSVEPDIATLTFVLEPDAVPAPAALSVAP